MLALIVDSLPERTHKKHEAYTNSRSDAFANFWAITTHADEYVSWSTKNWHLITISINKPLKNLLKIAGVCAPVHFFHEHSLASLSCTKPWTYTAAHNRRSIQTYTDVAAGQTRPTITSPPALNWLAHPMCGSFTHKHLKLNHCYIVSSLQLRI